MKRAQILIALAGLAALSSLTSCTTNQAAFMPSLPKVEAHVISGDVRPLRSIASTTDVTILDAEFRQILNSDNVAEQTRAQIDHAARVFFFTEGLLHDYDAKIDDVLAKGAPPSTLQIDDSYAKLLTAWSMREEHLAKLKYFYSSALAMQLEEREDNTLSRLLTQHSIEMENAFRDALISSPNSINRLAKQDAIHEIISATEEFHDFQVARENGKSEIVKRTDSLHDSLVKQLIDDGEAFYARNGAQLARETENARKDADLKKELDMNVPDMKKHLAEQFSDREPASSAGLSAGVGRKGMMNGNEFAPGVWALTFDDGPHPSYTPQDLQNLQSAGLKATFFWLASNVTRMPSIVSKAKEAGMTLANHSFSHPQLPKLGPSGLAHEIDGSTAIDVKAYGFKPKFFRCPYGACGSQTSAIRQKIAAQGMISVIWNVDSLDWQDKNPASVYARTKKQMAVQKHGIILFHDIHPQSVTASKMLMADFKAGQQSGRYRTVTIQQAFDELNSAEGMK